jgi:hypothetical protein
MRKKSYPLESDTLSIATPPTETYNGKEIPVVVTTTAGVFVQSEQSIKISTSEELPKLKTPKILLK